MKDTKDNLIPILLCPHCKLAIPSIEIIIDHVLIKCSHCKIEKMILIQDYLEQTKLEHKTNHQCSISQHAGRFSQKYCVNCGEWMCQECLIIHQQKSINYKHVILSKEVINSNIDSFNYYCQDCHLAKAKNICSIKEHQVLELTTMSNDIDGLLTKEKLISISQCSNKNITELIGLMISNYYLFKSLNLYESSNNIQQNINAYERIGTIINGKKEGYHRKTYFFKRKKYEGYWKNDKQNGKGKCINFFNDSYEGEFIDDKKEGYGVYKWHYGEKYEGYWKNDKQHGKGIKTYSNGDSYEGEWIDDKLEGYGVFKDNYGEKYEGYWENNKQHGKGKHTYSNGDTYEGGFIDDKKEGYGIYKWNYGDKYEGYWKKDKQHGKGKYNYSNGDTYEGGFIDDKKEGYGVYKWHYGYKYDGYWKNDKQHGKGKYTYSDDGSYISEFIDDKKEESGVYKLNDEEKYEGYWMNNKKHAKEKHTYADDNSLNIKLIDD